MTKDAMVCARSVGLPCQAFYPFFNIKPFAKAQSMTMGCLLLVLWCLRYADSASSRLHRPDINHIICQLGIPAKVRPGQATGGTIRRSSAPKAGISAGTTRPENM